MCSVIIGGFIILCIVALYIGGLMIGADIVFGVLLLMALGRFIKSLGMKSSKMKCRNCGSTHVKLSSVVDGHDYSSAVNHGLWTRFYSGRSKVRRKRISVCQDCGFADDYLMPEDVKHEKSEALGGVFIFGVIFAGLMILTLSVFSGTTEGKKGSDDGEVWGSEITPLSEFRYYCDGDYMCIQEYLGDSDAVRISDTYDVDGVDKQVLAVDGTFLSNNDVKSVIIPDGVIQVQGYTFNSCNVKYLYLPKSLEDFNGWNYFHDMKVIYYGGSQDDWNKLCQVERSDLDVQQIICDTSISDLVN